MTATSTQSLEPDLSGDVLDRYRLVRCLGMGGMGAVYEAEHTALGKRVAVKVLRQQFSAHEVARKRFLREARAITRVTHPHVVDVSDFGETANGRVYFVMELLAGRELGRLLEGERRLPWPRTQDLLLQVVSALGAAHDQGVVHRDVKPSNCFLVDVPGLDGRDFVKVLDFGIAKLSGKHGEETQALTSTDEVFGTVGYMAPEMAMGIGNDPRSDVYAVGVMMYRMLVGELPFEGGTAFQILARHVSEPPVPPRAKDPTMPEGVERIILRALAKLPDQRFASMQALAEALRRGDVVDAPLTGATMRLDGGTSHERLRVERTASLSASMAAIATGPWATVEQSGRTEVITSSRAVVARARSGAVPAVAMPTAEYELDDGARVPAGRGVAARSGEGRWKVLLGGGIALGAVLAAGVVAGVVASIGEPTSERVEGPRVVTVEPERPERVEPPARVEPAEQVTVPLEPEPEPEPEPEQVRVVGAQTEQVPALGSAVVPVAPAQSAAPRRKRAPKSDASVAAGARRKLVERCRGDGRTRVRIEGMIGTGGTPLSVLVSPAHGPGACAKTAIKSVSFAPGDEIRSMPVIEVDL